MLRRLTLGFALVIAAATAIVACSTNSTNSTLSVGPNFPSQTLYASNSTQDAVSIYPPGTATGAGPAYQIGGSQTTFTGPQYLTFDNLSNLYVTNYNVSSNAGSIVEIKTLATGNVLPLNAVRLGTDRARGIAFYLQPSTVASASPAPAFAVAVVNSSASAGFTSQIIFFNDLLGAFQTIAGPNTKLNIPSGVAFDKSNNLYVTNIQSASVDVYALPTPAPTPSPTPSTSPSPSPSPSPTASGATASPSPTPSPTATPINITPIRTISGAASGLGQPSGIALDSNGNIYVSDPAAVGAAICGGTKSVCPAVLVFASGSSTPKAIAGSNTLLNAPTDVKVDKTGNIYVGDTTTAGAGVVYMFAPGATGNVGPKSTYTSPGAVIGIGIAP